MAVPNKTIYVSDGDLKLYQRAQELAGGNLSAAIAGALKRYVDVQEGLREGFDDVVVRVGRRLGPQGPVHRRPRRRVARQPAASAPTTTASGAAATGKYVLHVERSAEWWTVDAEGKPVPAGAAGWASATSATAASPRSRRSRSVATLDELRDKVWLARPSSSTWSPAPPASRPWKSSTSERAPPGGGSREVRDDRHDRTHEAARSPRPAAPAVQVRGLRKSYGKQVVLDGIDLDVPEGTVFALLGPERRRQDDRGPHPLDADLGRRRRGPHRRLRRRPRARRRPRR